MKKKLSITETLQACFIVFQKNTEDTAFNDFITKILPNLDNKVFAKKEWYAFVFSAIYFGLAEHAPAHIVLEFVRSIKHILKEYNFSDTETTEFLDNNFQIYIKLVIENTLKECPKIFFERVLNKSLSEVDKNSVMSLSSAMAMLFANCSDIFEQYEYSLNE